MAEITDGPVSSRFTTLRLASSRPADGQQAGMSESMQAGWEHAPSGRCTAWGIPFDIGNMVVLRDQAVEVGLPPTRARWLVFLHTSDVRPLELDAAGLIPNSPGEGRLNELAATYVLCYTDGSEARAAIRRRRQIGAFTRRWGENCFEAVCQRKPYSFRAAHEQAGQGWGKSQTRADAGDFGEWMNWLWAWENPHPEKVISGLRFEPGSGTVVISAVSAGNATSQPLRWQARHKACLKLPQGTAFDPTLDEVGLLKQVQLDMGQVISAARRPVYPNQSWENTANNQIPPYSPDEILIEYTAHPDACFHLPEGKKIELADLEKSASLADFVQSGGWGLAPVAAAGQNVRLRVCDARTHRPVPVKLHVHGEAGEYLAPVDRHRILNPAWFEDYSVDFAQYSWGPNLHACTYINGETTLKLPLGKVYIEVSKGFEIRPVRMTAVLSAETEEITIEVEKVLPWREKGWVTADTHVHFLSPISALLEGSAEGVNVINLLASQWGELMTNVGDFDGQTTWGAKEAGGDGEYLVRVGTENRQHVLGHISLLGYRGGIIAPMTTGGPDESALGDPVDVLLTEWARTCRKQDGIVVLPHFPNPRAEHAASIVSGDIDALEMTSWGNLYLGIDPYSLSDWYRYLNCGYLVPAVGGTDKMSADTAVGTVRTYAHLDPQAPFTYDGWKDAVRRKETFVTYGPLIEFSAAGQPMGSQVALPAGGGTVDVHWEVATATVPVSRVQLVVNGEIRQESALAPAGGSGHWSVRVEKSAWLALLVRGGYADKPEIITAHSTPVMVNVAGTQLLAAADAVTILDQIEGALAYLDTVGTRAEDRAYRRMRLVLEAAHRTLHNRMHQQGQYHDHNPQTDHKDHH